MGKPKKIVINTGGGDAPGLNAVIRGVVLAAHEKGWETWGCKYGYRGLHNTEFLVKLTPEMVWHITDMGGTILGTANRGNPFEYPVKQPDGSVKVIDASDEIVVNFKKLGFDALIAIGGDGSLRLAQKLLKKGIPVIGVPKTIDNDLSATVMTFGFDTAVSTATDAIDKLHTTARSHERVMVVEVMGRYAGWIALNAGVSGSADVILLPEIPFDIEKVCAKIRGLEKQGQTYAIVVVAEGAKPLGGEMATLGPKDIDREVRLGGIAQRIATAIEQKTGKETRVMVLGHLQRGGAPTTFDRLLSLRFGSAAVRFLEEGKSGVMVALAPPTVKAVPIEEAIGKMKAVPLDCDTILTARSLGICLGD
ncbi:MAG: ATP-dependent 6-phosphofructokinase [Planctomycetota bacterium]|nr:ATP-dependent 6-phosphofructokinase [Planctomycetota bacterium]